MNFITIDQEQCKQDGLCVEICPMGIIEKPPGGYPRLEVNGDQFCISCGHCVAVCPHGALHHGRIPLKECVSIRKGLRVSADAIEEFLKARRSIRSFRDKSASRDVLERIIDVTRWAPSASNRQPVSWLVIENQSQVRQLAALVADWLRKTKAIPRFLEAWDRGKDMILRGAPHLIVAHADKENRWAPVDCAIALTYMELAAKSQGLGTCWAGLLIRAIGVCSPVAEFLNLPDGNEVYGAVMLGYPEYRYQRIPNRNEARVRWL
jgi:nitroreductase/NAD-dependent dihydropyrimidine dehydrogenase PreA subunit